MEDKLRIRYKTDQTHINIDKAIFNRWEEKLISTTRARKELEQSIGYEITDEQFVLNANWLGYHRGGI